MEYTRQVYTLTWVVEEAAGAATGAAADLVGTGAAGSGFLAAAVPAGFLDVSTDALTLAFLSPESENLSFKLIYK